MPMLRDLGEVWFRLFHSTGMDLPLDTFRHVQKF